MAPGGGWGGDGFCEIEFDAEAAAFGLANEAVAEGFLGGEKEGPDIGFRGGDQFGGEGVGGEILLAGRAGGGGVTAVLGDLVGGAVFVAVVVFEAETGGGARDHPSARAVFADVEGDLDFVFAAGAHVQDEGLAGEGGVGGAGAFGDFAGEGLAAEGAEFGPKFFLGGRERAGGEREEEGEEEDGEARPGAEGAGGARVRVRVRGKGKVRGKVKGPGAVGRARGPNVQRLTLNAERWAD